MDTFNRRTFIEGVSAGAACGFFAGWPGLARAQAGVPELAGRQFELEIAATQVNFTGRAALATAVNGSVPGPTLRWREGEEVTLHVTNHLDVPTSIHWHGIVLPWNMDGVPGLSFPGIAPGTRFTYRFRVAQSGTYWYHSHSGFQEQTGLYGALVIEPREPDPVGYDREHTILLSDWTDSDPMRVFARLKKESHYYNYRRRTLGEIRAEMQEKGRARLRAERAMWNRMRMTDRDIADVTGAAYTFLMNGQPPAADFKALFRRGERVRLRFINGSAMTLFDVRIPGLDVTVVAADGQNVEPVTVHEFRIGVAETYDVIVRPSDDSAYAIFAQAIDRSGYARGTLTPDPALSVPVPALDPPPLLSMVDMGMAMGGVGTASAMPMGGPAGTELAAAADTSGHAAAGETAGHAAAAGPVGHVASPQTSDHAAMGHGAAGASMAMDHAAMGPGTSAVGRLGPGVDMRAESPEPRYQDPGVGLRERSWPVLTYGALKRLGEPRMAAIPEREIELHLTGNMHRYMWSFDGRRYSEAEPILLELGERVRFVLINDTMMTHPIHLHGLWSDLETGAQGEFTRKHTVVVQPGQRVAYVVHADAPGPWAYHCHLIYHMEAGMFRVVQVA